MNKQQINGVPSALVAVERRCRCGNGQCSHRTTVAPGRALLLHAHKLAQGALSAVKQGLSPRTRSLKSQLDASTKELQQLRRDNERRLPTAEIIIDVQ